MSKGIKSKLNTDLILTILFLELICFVALVTLPMMFASTDNAAIANNVSESEYAMEYSTGQDTIEIMLVLIDAIMIILGILLFWTIVKGFL